jgi:hypothetical protein
MARLSKAQQAHLNHLQRKADKYDRLMTLLQAVAEIVLPNDTESELAELENRLDNLEVAITSAETDIRDIQDQQSSN